MKEDTFSGYNIPLPELEKYIKRQATNLASARSVLSDRQRAARLEEMAVMDDASLIDLLRSTRAEVESREGALDDAMRELKQMQKWLRDLKDEVSDRAERLPAESDEELHDSSREEGNQ